MKLKNILLPLFVSASLNSMKAQQVQTDSTKQLTENFQTTPETSNDLTVDHLYAGMYGIVSVDEEGLKNWKPVNSGDLRVGWSAHRNMWEKVNVNGMMAYDQPVGAEWSMFSLYGVTYEPIHWSKISVGKVPTAATLMVGSPVTPGGHFLFTAEAQAPGGALWARVDQNIGDGSISASAVRRNGDDELSAYITKWPFSIAAIRHSQDESYEVGASWIGDLKDNSKVFALVWLNSQAISYSAMWTSKPGRKTFDDVGLFVDWQYDRDQSKVATTQIGAIKNLSAAPIGAKLWVGYDIVKKNVQAIIFINLNK